MCKLNDKIVSSSANSTFGQVRINGFVLSYANLILVHVACLIFWTPSDRSPAYHWGRWQ